MEVRFGVLIWSPKWKLVSAGGMIEWEFGQSRKDVLQNVSDPSCCVINALIPGIAKWEWVPYAKKCDVALADGGVGKNPVEHIFLV